MNFGIRFAPLVATLALLCASTNASASFLSLVAPANASPNETVTVSMVFQSTVTDNLQSIDAAVSYDATIFTASNVRLGSLTSPDFGFLASLATPGEVLVTSSTNSGLGINITPTTIGSVLLFDLTVRPSPVFGPSPINLQSLFGTTRTAVNEGQIGLSPAPLNAFDAGIDRNINIVPEPSAVVLLGLGGLLLASAHRRFANRS